MDAAELVVKVARSVALQGTFGASIEELWEFAAAALPQDLDDLLREAVWSWIRTHPAMICTDAGVPLSGEDLKQPISELEKSKQIRVYATETEQWLALTGNPKEKNAVGAFPFQLLCAVSRAREKGLTAIEINKLTGQDPRSIFGRVQLLESLGLVRKFPISRDKNHTHLVVYHDFCRPDVSLEDTDTGLFDKTRRSHDIIHLARSQPNSLILYSEAYRQLEFNKFPRGFRMFANLCRTLEDKGCIQRVNVHSPSNQSVLFKCIKYIKDLDGDVDDVEEEDDDDDEVVPEAEQDIDLDSVVEVKDPPVYYNLFWPLEAQIYSLVESHGTKGISAMEIYRKLCGEQFHKPLSIILTMMTAPEKTPDKQGYNSLKRGIDFIQRLKYYCYFTRITHTLYSQQRIPARWGTIKQAKDTDKTIQDVNCKYSTVIAGSCAITVTTNNQLAPYFHGDGPPGDARVLVTTDIYGKKRGRRKKEPTQEDIEAEAAIQSYRPQKPTLPPIAKRLWIGGSPSGPLGPALQLVPEHYSHKGSADPKASVKANAPTEAAPGLTLAQQKRVAAVKTILEENGGVVEGGVVLGRLIDARLDDGKTIDRRTIRKVLDHLEEEHYIKQETLQTKTIHGVDISRPLVYLASLNEHSPKYIEVKQQILSRLGARRTVVTQTVSLPKQTLTHEKVEELFENVDDKPKRLKTLLQQAIKERRERSERQIRPMRARTGPRASSLVNIPGRSDPTKFTSEPNNLKRPRMSQTNKPFQPREIPIDDDLLFRAVVISRSLYSKNDTTIDWDIVTSCIPGLKIRRARQKWINIRDNFGGAKAVQSASYQWENLFLKFYAKGEITVQDPNSLKFDLRQYVEFWRKHYPGNILSQPLWRRNHSRLLSRKEYEQAYGAIRAKSVLNPLDSIPNMPSMIKVDEHLANTSYSFDPLDDDEEVQGESYTDVQKQVRIVIGMDANKYVMEEAEERLQRLGEKAVQSALKGLTDKKTVIYLPRDSADVYPGRNYAFSDKMLSALNYKHSHEIFALAQDWEEEMQENELTRVQLSIKDDYMVSLLELCAMDVARLERANIKTGRLIANYQSRHISRELLDFDIDIRLGEVPEPPNPDPMPLDTEYVWGFNEGVEIWESLAKKILTLIQSKPHIPMRHLSDYVKMGFDRSEIQAVVNWLVASDFVEESDGYRVKPRWYHAFR